MSCTKIGKRKYDYGDIVKLMLAGDVAQATYAVGVVFGDIGTSPLYTMKEVFNGPHAIPLTVENVLGILSLIFWSIFVTVSVKYVFNVNKADNKGEGGTFALLELIPKSKLGKFVTITTILSIIAAAMLCGDAIITPVMSVLSAIEGLNVVFPGLPLWIIVLISEIILIGIFSIQKKGTAVIGRLSSRIMITWFISIAILGTIQIILMPKILLAINPWYAVKFFINHRMHGFVVLGAVVLCVTGGEALYADLGHFNSKTIRNAWFFVWPCLILNYFGQGAGLLLNPEIVTNPFYGIVPKILLLPMVGLATMATIIASQAVITGLFSITMQAIQLNLLPRMEIINTSGDHRGQIYIPQVNFLLMVACIGVLLIFQESSRLAGAYGIAVTGTMSITSILYCLVLIIVWEKSKLKSILLTGLFLAFDLSFLGSNLIKIPDGGWFTLGIAIIITTIMITWKKGRKILYEKLSENFIASKDFIADFKKKVPHRIPGTAVFMTISPTGTPITLLHFFKHVKTLHEKIIFLTIQSLDIPYSEKMNRLKVEHIENGFYRVLVNYGFMEKPDMSEITSELRERGIDANIQTSSFFLGRETLQIKEKGFNYGISAILHLAKQDVCSMTGNFNFLSRDESYLITETKINILRRIYTKIKNVFILCTLTLFVLRNISNIKKEFFAPHLKSKKEMPVWQKKLFLAISRNAPPASNYFNIPSSRVMEVGIQVAI